MPTPLQLVTKSQSMSIRQQGTAVSSREEEGILEVLQTKSQRCPPRKNGLNLIRMRKPEMFYTQVPEKKHCAECQRCQPLSTELSGQYKPHPPRGVATCRRNFGLRGGRTRLNFTN